MISDTDHPKPDSKFPASEWRPSLAEALVSCLCIRDLLRLREHYPNAIRDDDAEELRSALAGHLESLMSNGDLEFIRHHLPALKVTIPALHIGRNALALNVAITAMFNSLLLKVPGLRFKSSEPWFSQESVDRGIAACQERIGPRLRELAQQLVDVKLYDCRIPVGDSTFADPRRFVQMVREYWSVASSLILNHADAQVGIQPHPLLRMIVGLRARIDGYLERLGDAADIREARDSAACLLEAVATGDPEELSVAPESTRHRVHVVNRLLEDLRLKAGSRVFPLTHEEEIFLVHARIAVAQHHQDVEKAWRRMIATAVGAGRPGAAPVASPRAASSEVPSNSAGGHVVATRPDERLGIPAQSEPRSAPAPVERQGQPCFGLPPAAIRVIRAYKDWEARRAGRRGLPTPPTIDDLEAETELARATVVRARRVLIDESLLEQIPGAVGGKLRLTQRGLSLELPA